MNGLKDEEIDRLRNLLRVPQLLGGDFYHNSSHGCTFAKRAIVDRGNLRLRWRVDTGVCSVYIRVNRHHVGWFTEYDYDDWVDLTDSGPEHPIWNVVRREMDLMTKEVAAAVDPHPVLKPKPDGALSLVPDVENVPPVITAKP